MRIIIKTKLVALYLLKASNICRSLFLEKLMSFCVGARKRKRTRNRTRKRTRKKTATRTGKWLKSKIIITP